MNIDTNICTEVDTLQTVEEAEGDQPAIAHILHLPNEILLKIISYIPFRRAIVNLSTVLFVDAKRSIVEVIWTFGGFWVYKL